MNLLGCDVSHWQGEMRWDFAIANEISFALVKATEGANFVDDRLEQNARALSALELPFGTYHYWRNDVPAEKQAAHFLKYWRGKIRPTLDLEQTRGVNGNLGQNIWAWLTIVGEKTGQTPMVYTSPSFITSFLWQYSWLDQYPLWIANYRNDSPSVPLPWQPTRWTVWQFTANGKGSKYGAQSKSIDLNVLNGSNVEELLYGITSPQSDGTVSTDSRSW